MNLGSKYSKWRKKDKNFNADSQLASSVILTSPPQTSSPHAQRRNDQFAPRLEVSSALSNDPIQPLDPSSRNYMNCKARNWAACGLRR